MDTTQYCDVESNTLEFTIRNSESGNTFSSDSVRTLFIHLSQFIGSRIVRRWQYKSEPPKIMKVTIRIEIE